MSKQTDVFQVAFDYKQLVREFKKLLGERIARYVVENPTIRIPDIARAFGVTHNLIQTSMVANGVRRVRGCKTYHFAKAQATRTGAK